MAAQAQNDIKEAAGEEVIAEAETQATAAE